MQWVLPLIAIALASGAQAQTTSPAPERPAQFAPGAREAAVLADSIGTGPFKAIKQLDSGLPDHTIYRPRDLARLGATKLGVMVWGNGGCREDGASARQHLLEIASHGYVAIAPGTIRSGPGFAPAPLSTDRIVRTTTRDVAAGLDWILAENQRRGSPYYHRIDPALVAVAGHSCGGLEAIVLAADPRIRAVIVHNSGVFAEGASTIIGLTVTKAMLRGLHTPVLYILGGPTDRAWANGNDDVRRIDHVPVFLASTNVGHGGTFAQPDGGIVAQVAWRWLEWQLRGDRAAATWFVGRDCHLCRDPAWTVERKRLP